MATIPPRFVYENAGKYFKGELDTETAKKWEKIVTTLSSSRKSNDDFDLPLGLGVGIAIGMLL